VDGCSAYARNWHVEGAPAEDTHDDAAAGQPGQRLPFGGAEQVGVGHQLDDQRGSGKVGFSERHLVTERTEELGGGPMSGSSDERRERVVMSTTASEPKLVPMPSCSSGGNGPGPPKWFP
jgi:hypothetical protein